MTILQVQTWTPSRWAKWKECPAKVKYEDLMKLCPSCFRGRISGGFDGQPVVCDTCTRDQPTREALERGNLLDDAVTKAVEGQASFAPGDLKLDYMKHDKDQPLAVALKHPKILALAKALKKAKAMTQVTIVLDRAWRPVSKFTKGAYGRLRLDALLLKPKVAEVIDWKSGNIDKSKGVIRERPEYADSMRLYQIGVLSTHPQAEVKATMAFLDAPLKIDDPFKSLPVLKRSALRAAQEEADRKMEPMFRDKTFVPRPGMQCRWCDYSKAKGGPCQFGE